MNFGVVEAGGLDALQERCFYWDKKKEASVRCRKVEEG
jgi:hypothetical protein